MITIKDLPKSVNKKQTKDNTTKMTTRTPLRRDLADLKQKVYLLGEKCIEASELYNSLLENFTDNLELRFTSLTNEIKTECKELVDQCFLVLTLQQPLIRDLRFVIGSLQVILNLEKIIDQHSSNITLTSEINIIEDELKYKLITMAKKVLELLRTSLTLYLSSNMTLVEQITKEQTEVNYLHDLLYKQILKKVAQESGHKAQIEAQVLAIIRSLEKVGNLIIGISEQVNYIIIGKSEA